MRTAFSPQQPLVLVGCGNMGAALLAGWLAQGLDPNAVHVLARSQGARALELGLTPSALEPPKVTACALVLALKPQSLGPAAATLRPLLGPQSLLLSVAAGIGTAKLGTLFPETAQIVWAMPNTPAAIGQGMTLLTAGSSAPSQPPLADTLMQAVGQTLWLEETAMHAGTALSGCGPAYVFALIEALVAAGISHGLSASDADRLARVTIAGAGALAAQSPHPARTLREAVTSPNGVTAAALTPLLDPQTGLGALFAHAINAAITRSQELGAAV